MYGVAQSGYIRSMASAMRDIMPFAAPRGTQDILPDDARRWQWLESTFRRICTVYGYGEIRTPIFEATELFTRGVGLESDGYCLQADVYFHKPWR